MAIPKKGTRIITIDDVNYRWLIRRKATYGQTDYGIGRIHVAIEHAENPGTKLHIYTDKGHAHDYATKTVSPVTPGDISKWIKGALSLEWSPEIKGPQFSVSIQEGVMELRN